MCHWDGDMRHITRVCAIMALNILSEFAINPIKLLILLGNREVYTTGTGIALMTLLVKESLPSI